VRAGATSDDRGHGGCVARPESPPVGGNADTYTHTHTTSRYAPLSCTTLALSPPSVRHAGLALAAAGRFKESERKPDSSTPYLQASLLAHEDGTAYIPGVVWRS
jgi:hypothetical protein